VTRCLVLATVVAHIFGGTPAAVDYRATITSTPPSVEARIVDGDRLWLKLPNGQIHEHRLYALNGRWRVPADAAGIVSGTLVRLPRPAVWPWIALAVGLAAAALAAFRWKKLAIVFPLVTVVASVTAYTAHTPSTALLVLIPLGGAVALALLIPEKTRLPAILAIGAFGVYTGVALAPMVWRALPLTSLPFALARAAVVVSLVAGAATCVLYVLSAPATYRGRSESSRST
jgi:hypothetical protein